jgi:membrane-associated phospholipid phosphatase
VSAGAPPALLFAVLLAGLLGGCAALPHDRAWGADTTPAPGWTRVVAAARAAATDPEVWVPVVGAAVLQIDDLDQRASDWARENTPVFGSTEDARRWSDDLRSASGWAWYASIVAAESGEGAGQWVNKGRGLIVGAAALAATGLTTSVIKSGTGRERPNGLDRRSFPSGHASGSAVLTQLASRHLEFAPVAPPARRALDLGLDGLTLGTAWARVEAGMHYPSDVLAGMALGRFVALWFNDAFLDPRRGTPQWTVLIYARADLNPACGRVNKYC